MIRQLIEGASVRGQRSDSVLDFKSVFQSAIAAGSDSSLAELTASKDQKRVFLLKPSEDNVNVTLIAVRTADVSALYEQTGAQPKGKKTKPSAAEIAKSARELSIMTWLRVSYCTHVSSFLIFVPFFPHLLVSFCIPFISFRLWARAKILSSCGTWPQTLRRHKFAAT